MKTPILETDRLILRPVTLSDAPAVQKYFNNWNIIQHLSLDVPWPYPNDGAEGFLTYVALPAMERGDSMVWGVTLKDAENADEVVGIVDYRLVANDHGNRGFWLAEHLWRQGLMSEAITAIQDYLFFDYGLPELIVYNAIDNEGSRRVKEKTGAELIGESVIDHHSGQKDAQKWRITRESWAQFRGRSLADLPPVRASHHHKARQNQDPKL